MCVSESAGRQRSGRALTRAFPACEPRARLRAHAHTRTGSRPVATCARGHVGACTRPAAPIQSHYFAAELERPSLSRHAPRHDAVVLLRLLLPRALPLSGLPRPPTGPPILAARAHVQELMNVRIAPRTHDRPAAGALVPGLACRVHGLHTRSPCVECHARSRERARQGHLARVHTPTHTHTHITVPQALHGAASCGIAGPRVLLFPPSSSACCRESAGVASSSISARGGISVNSGTGKR